MLEVTDNIAPLDLSTALRDLADTIDDSDEYHTVVCVIGRGEAARIYALGANLPDLLARTSVCLEGVVASILSSSERSH